LRFVCLHLLTSDCRAFQAYEVCSPIACTCKYVRKYWTGHRCRSAVYNVPWSWSREKAYRAKTAAGHEITFTVIESGDGNWSSVELDEGGVVEPNVWLNTDQLLWISAEPKRKLALSKAADEIIDVLENSPPNS
jgi:hypothetical protein